MQALTGQHVLDRTLSGRSRLLSPLIEVSEGMRFEPEIARWAILLRSARRIRMNSANRQSSEFGF